MTKDITKYIEFRFKQLIPFCARVYDGQGNLTGVILLRENSLDVLSCLFGEVYNFASFVQANMACEADTVIGFYDNNILVMLNEPTPFVPTSDSTFQLRSAAAREVKKEAGRQRETIKNLLNKK